MMIDSEDVEMHTVRDFIAANWSAFCSHCRERGQSDEQAEAAADAIYTAIGGQE